MSDTDPDRELYETFGDFLHEEPSVVEPLREWRLKQTREAIKRNQRRKSTEILTRSLCGHPPYDGGDG